MKLVTADLMQRIDREAIDKIGIPSLELMENAGRGIAEFILEEIDDYAIPCRTAVFCGKGNNGGDGFVIARYLHQAKHPVTIYFIGPPDKLSADAQANYKRAKEAGIELIEISIVDQVREEIDAPVIIDAIFGTGFSGAPRGLAAEMIERINDQDGRIVAVDLPSGLNADNGTFEGTVVAADFTCTLAQPKFGLYVSPGRELAGRVQVIPIGIPDSAIAKFAVTTELITPALVSSLLPYRPPDGHKGTFGNFLAIAGSTGLTGAAAMTAQSAIRSGCGMARIACPKSVLPIIASKTTEVMTIPMPDVAKKGALALRGLGDIMKRVQDHDAIAIGPGLGLHHETKELVRRLIARIDKPLVIDADGISALQGHIEILKGKTKPVILTPHPGEFARLTGNKPTDDIHDRIGKAKAFATEFGVTLVLKGSPSIVADAEGNIWVNSSGNAGMATGGSGDVLTGIIGSLLAQGMNAVDAAICGTYIHGLAGDLAADEFTQRAMIAGDIIAFLPEAFEWLE